MEVREREGDREREREVGFSVLSPELKFLRLPLCSHASQRETGEEGRRGGGGVGTPRVVRERKRGGVKCIEPRAEVS